ncbi:MAG: potassium transporter Kup [Actinobacteria bacterium]|nr:potassium transporter Kup [Actinomycetota bacterium]
MSPTGAAATETDEPGQHDHVGGRGSIGLAALSVAALGIVFGDIGTSPLYAFRETFEHHSILVDKPNVLGVCSLILWSLILVVSIKYVVFILRADNRGEGGILALTSLVVGGDTSPRIGRRLLGLLFLGLFGMALLYGDGIITPAISVLSATEGLEVAAPALSSWVLPIAVAILIVLFLLQRRGTGAVGALFGPVMIVWFSTLAVLGLARISGNLEILRAVNPGHAFEYLTSNGFDAFLSLGSVFLVVTGGEALYADLGHFGRRPIRIAWFAVAFPALVINYFGQGSLLLEKPEAISSPLFLMGPDWARWPLVIMAALAAVIASQALISGVFSLTVQAIQLDYLPRLTVRHTSAQHIGQVYLPLVNLLLAIGCISLVLTFQSSAGLAAAYGIAVTGTMGITTVLFYFFTRATWGWSTTKALAVCVPFAVMDFAFFGANVFKIPAGGWFPLVVAAMIMVAMTTWRTGRRVVAEQFAANEVTIEEFMRTLPEDVVRAPGTAVFMFRGNGTAPPALRTNTRHNRVLHERVILLSVKTDSVPYVNTEHRFEILDFGRRIVQITAHHGFMEEPDVPAWLDGMEVGGAPIVASETTFFLGRETVIPSEIVAMAPWRERLFAVMLRTAASASRFFRLPPDQVVEVGSQVKI